MPVEAKRISITDVALACGCSIATVSLVLNGRGKISEGTKRRVMKAAARLRYIPNPAGRSLRSRKTNTLGLCFYPSCGQLFRNVFYAEVMEGLEERLGKAGYDLLLCGSDFTRPEARTIALMTQRRVDAAIMLGAFPFKLIKAFHRLGVPMLLLDSNVDELPVDSITTDGFSAGKMIVEHLHQLGHRRMVMLAYDLEDYNIDLRTRGFQAALKERALPTSQSVIRTFVDNEHGLPLLLRRLRSSAPPTAVVCVNDTMAAFMMQRVREAGFKVPQQVSFVGYDDDTYARGSIPPLTTVAVDKAELGRAGADILLRRLREPGCPIGKTRLGVTLVKRASVADLS